jgi:signal transduction histidine kinase
MWDWKRWLVFSIPFIVVILGAIAWVLVRNTIRTRIRMARQLRDDPDINEWLVVFDWSRKILYLPTVLMSLIAAGLMVLHEQNWLFPVNPRLVGGIWLAVFFINFLIDEYEMNLKVLLIVLLVAVAMILWLTYLEWLWSFVNSFRHLGIQINSTGYLIIALVFLMAILVSWVKGLFYYAAITPNYLNCQRGPTETGEQVSREDYNTRIDTGDFLERVLGFGEIIVTFHDTRRPPLKLLVWGIGKKAKKLEALRGILAVERSPKDQSEKAEA